MKFGYKKIIVFIFLAALAIPFGAGAQTINFCGAENSFLSWPCPFGDRDAPVGKATFGGLVQQIIGIALIVAGSVAVIFLIYGAYLYITSHGNEELVETSKKTMKAAILGLVIVLVSFAIIAIISNILIGGQGGTGI